MARYGRKAQEEVEEKMHELKRGQLRSSSGQKVTNPKQAIAIALSEARREGGKVPPEPRKRASAKKASSTKKRTSAKKASSSKKRTSSKKTSSAKKRSSSKKR